MAEISSLSELAKNGDDSALVVILHLGLKRKYPKLTVLHTMKRVGELAEKMRAEAKQANEILDVLDVDYSKVLNLKIEPINGRVLYLILSQLRSKISAGERNMFDAELLIYSQAITKAKEIKVATSGGRGRSAKFDDARAETIRMYELGKLAGKWQTGRHHVPDAALEITPQVVAFSNGMANLAPTTTKPKEWIREHIGSKKNDAK